MPKFDYEAHKERMLQIVRVKQPATPVPGQQANNLPKLMNFLRSKARRVPQRI